LIRNSLLLDQRDHVVSNSSTTHSPDRHHPVQHDFTSGYTDPSEAESIS